jgi:hypothetical protein
MARSLLDPGTYEFPEPLLPCHMNKSESWAQLGGKKDKSLRRSASASGHFARSISEEKSRAFVRQQQRGLPKMVPENIRKEFHRYSVPGDGPMGLKNVNQVRRYFEFKGYIEGGENRSVTLAQFMQIYAYVEAKVLDWNLALEETNFYHVNTWLIQPATRTTNSALFEHIAERQQAPTWFLSHWWGEPLVNAMKCLRRHYSMRGLPSHAAYWICAFACREEELTIDFSDGLRYNAFFRAMQLARFKVLLLLDVPTGSGGLATPFKRMWCIFECSMCLDQVSAPIDTALVLPGSGEEVQLVCSGLTKFERTSDQYLAGRGLVAKVKREISFPDEIVRAALAFNVKMTSSSSEQDHRRILNYIIGQPQDDDPPRDHEKYDRLNKRLQGLFSMVYWHRALCKEKPVGEEPRKKHMAHLGHISNAIAGDTWRRSLSLCLAGCDLQDDDSVKWVAQGLPPNAETLSLNLQHAQGLSDHHLETIASLLPKGLQVLSLDLSGCRNVSDAGVMTFVQNLSQKVTTLSLGLDNTNVRPYLLELAKSESLKVLRERAASHGNKSQMSDPRSLDQQTEDRQSLLEGMLRSKPSSEVRARILSDLAKSGQSGDRLRMNMMREETEAVEGKDKSSEVYSTSKDPKQNQQMTRGEGKVFPEGLKMVDPEPEQGRGHLS